MRSPDPAGPGVDAVKRRSITPCPDLRTGMSRDSLSSRVVTGRYDTETDVLSIRITTAEAAESREVWPGIVAVYDAAGAVAGIEIRDASAARLAADQNLRLLAGGGLTVMGLLAR